MLSDGLRPPPAQTISEWSDANRVLGSKGSAEPGPWRTARTPYLREPMDCMGPYSKAEMVVLMFGAQTGKTEASVNVLGHLIDVEPGPTMYVSPTVDMAKRTSRQRIQPLIEETRVLRDLVDKSRARDEFNTMLAKDFPGGLLVMTGANSATGLRSMPARTIFFDEVDAFPADVDDEGSPVELALKRQSTFSDRKTWAASTPTTKGTSRIEALFETSSQCRYYVPCPHCGHRQVLIWAQVRWTNHDPETARYACIECGTLIEERFKTQMLAEGEWVAARPEETRVVGFHLSSLYSPHGWVRWADLAREFIAANAAKKRGDLSMLRVFINTRLAETFEEGTTPVGDLAKRGEDYALGSLPEGVLAVTAGIDVQTDRIECYVWGFGRADQMWLVDFRTFHGKPESRAPWEELAAFLETPVDGTLRLRGAAIDSGHSTAMVYDFVSRRRTTCLAIKGSSLPSQPVLGRPSAVERSKVASVGTRVYPIGTDTAKTLLYGRLSVTAPGPGYVHIPRAIADEVPDFWDQMTAERQVTTYRGGTAVKKWVKHAGKRNEALDCMVYALAAWYRVNGHRMSAAAWARLEAAHARKVAPPVTDTGTPPEVVAPVAAHQRVRRRGRLGGQMGNW